MANFSSRLDPILQKLKKSICWCCSPQLQNDIFISIKKKYFEASFVDSKFCQKHDEK